MASLRQSTLLERWRKRFLLFTFWKIQDRQPSLISPVLKVFFSIFLQEPELGIWTIKFKFAKYCFEIRIFHILVYLIKILWTRGPKGSKGEAKFEVAEYVLPKVSFLFDNLFQFVLKLNVWLVVLFGIDTYMPQMSLLPILDFSAEFVWIVRWRSAI